MAAHDGESGASNEGTSIQFNSVVALNKLSNEEFITGTMTIFADINIDVFSQTF